MLHTTRPSSGFGKTLSEEELQEFNGVTYDKIKAMKSLPKLIRLEKYMREEGFPQTADMARKMVIELGGKDSCPHDWEPQFADVDAEFDAFLKNFDSWQATVKGADHKLRGLHQTKEDGQPGEGAKLISAKKSRSNGNFIDNAVPREPSKIPQKDLRSGRAYYEQWDKYAAEAEKEIEEEEKARQAAANAKPNPESNGDKKSDATVLKKEKKESLQQRLLSLAQTKSVTEREWFAEREREKGNDLFKAKEYTASLDAYSLAIQLYSGSSLAFGNRAAANIKLKRWEEAHQDCCKALELDSTYIKALMRRGLASLEMDRPEDAMQDLEAALTLDPNSQETIALIRRTEPILLKLQQKRAEELELEKKKAEEVKREKTTYVNFEPGTSKRATRMTIEEVEETSKVEIKDDSGAANSFCSNGHGKGGGDFREKPKSKPVYNWPSKQKVNAKMSSSPPLKAQPKEHAVKKVNTGPAIDEKTNIDSSVNGREPNEVSKDEGEKFGTVVYHHPKVGTPVVEGVQSSDENEVNKVPNGQDSAQSGDIEYPQEILDAMETQKSIAVGHVAFGKPNVTYIGAQGNGNLKPFEIVNQVHTHKESKELNEENNDVKLATNGNTKPAENAKQAQTQGILADEWRLTGNSFYAQGNIERAEASYTTSLKFDASSPNTLTNRAMCRLKLKNFTGAAEDASNAISTNPKIHKAYYRRGLARRALGQLEAAKLDFEAVLALIPGDKSVIAELESLEVDIREAQYIPMRVGPMTFEEVKDDMDVTVPCTPRRGSALASGMSTPRPAEFNSTPSTLRPESTTESPRSTTRPDEKNPNGEVYTKMSKELTGDDGVSQGSQAGGQSSQPGIQSSQGATQRTHSSSQGIQTSGVSKSADQCTEDHTPGFQFETRSSQSGAQSSQGSKSGLQGAQPPAREGVPACREDPVSLQEDVDDSVQQAEEEKEKGNACFKKGQYTLAVECYTRSLELVPISAAVLSNRALSYIHLREYKKAVEDSSEAINIAPGYTKAFHRRATASHKLGKLQDALHDYQVVATFSLNDKKLKKDIEQLEKEIEFEEEKAKAKAKMTKPKSLPIRTTEPSEDGELLTPVKTTMFKPQQPSPTSKEYQDIEENTADAVVNTPVDGASSPSVRSDSVVALNNSLEVKAARKEVKKEIVVPRKPHTAIEFERVCNSLKGQPEVQCEYVKSIEVEKYPILFKELLSAGIMRCFIEALRRGFMPDDPQGALVVLRGLTKVKRFSMTLMLMAPSEKLTLETLLYWLEFSSDISSTHVADLRVLYHIV